jgi:hypothetical protein
MPEIWKDVPGQEGRYRVSNLGRVIGPSGRVLKPWFHKGYPYVHIGGKRDKSLVCYLVLRAFVGERPDGFVICHANGDRSDSRLENLRYDTQRENTRDTVMYGGINTQKLSPSSVEELVRRRRGGERRKDLAKEYGVDESTIWRAVSGRTFTRLREEGA